VVEEKPQADFKGLTDKFKSLKEKGNLQFKKKAHKEAIKHFSEAIRIFEEAGKPLEDAPEEFKLLLSQLYTNRSLAFHILNQQASALSDASFVLNHIDAKNSKALYRRAHALRSQGKFEEAARDLQVVMKEAGNDQIKKELDECMKKFVDQRK